MNGPTAFAPNRRSRMMANVDDVRVEIHRDVVSSDQVVPIESAKSRWGAVPEQLTSDIRRVKW